MKFEITEHIHEQDKKTVYQGLLEYNTVRIENAYPKELGIYWRNSSGMLMAGLIGDTHGYWLSIKYLWVHRSFRRQQIGSKLLEQAEETARNRGCKYAFLDTFSFQAPEFYKKQGYHCIFTLMECPITGKRFYFTKELTLI